MNNQTLAAEAADWKNTSSGTRWERFRDSGLLDSGLNFADSPFQRWPLQITALLVVSVIAAASLLMGPLHHPSRIVTAMGEQRSVTLADGSLLELNSDSDARIAFTAGERRVVLARGEARAHGGEGRRKAVLRLDASGHCQNAWARRSRCARRRSRRTSRCCRVAWPSLRR